MPNSLATACVPTSPRVWRAMTWTRRRVCCMNRCQHDAAVDVSRRGSVRRFRVEQLLHVPIATLAGDNVGVGRLPIQPPASVGLRLCQGRRPHPPRPSCNGGEAATSPGSDSRYRRSGEEAARIWPGASEGIHRDGALANCLSAAASKGHHEQYPARSQQRHWPGRPRLLSRIRASRRLPISRRESEPASSSIQALA